MKFATWEFWDRWLQTWSRNSGTHNGGSNMAGQNTDSSLNGMKFSILRLLASLITNPRLTFWNSKWRILCGWLNATNYLNYLNFCTQGFSGSLITNLSLPFRNSKKWIQYSWLKLQKVTWLGWNLVLQILWRRWLRIRAQRSKIQNVRFNMADQNVKSKKLGRKGFFVA